MPFIYRLPLIALTILLSHPPLTAQEPTIKPRPRAGGRLPAPSGITARQTASGKVEVSWGSVPDAVKYQITRSAPPAPLTVLPPVTDTIYIDQDIQPGTTYYYLVQAIDASGTPGLKGGTQPVTAAAPSAPRREIKPVSVVSATAFPDPYVTLNWISTQGGVSYLVERAPTPDDPKGAAVQWQTRTTTQALPCCHWSVLDDAGDVRCHALLYRVTAVDTADASNRSTPTVSRAVFPCTTHHFSLKEGNFVLPPRIGNTFTLHVGGISSLFKSSSDVTSMDEEIVGIRADGGVVGKAVGVTYIVGVIKAWDGAPDVIPYRVLVLP